jgi:hypothetical protein
LPIGAFTAVAALPGNQRASFERHRGLKTQEREAGTATRASDRAAAAASTASAATAATFGRGDAGAATTAALAWSARYPRRAVERCPSGCGQRAGFCSTRTSGACDRV